MTKILNSKPVNDLIKSKVTYSGMTYVLQVISFGHWKLEF